MKLKRYMVTADLLDERLYTLFKKKISDNSLNESEVVRKMIRKYVGLKNKPMR